MVVPQSAVPAGDVHRIGPADPGARARLIGRLRASIGAAVADQGRTVVQAASDHEVSWPIALAAFATHTQAALPAKTPQVARLGIDEIRPGKARFGWCPARTEARRGRSWRIGGTSGWLVWAAAPGLLRQVEGRTAAAVSAWLEAQGRQWRAGVEVVAIDMCTVFKAAIRASLRRTRLVVDRFTSRNWRTLR